MSSDFKSEATSKMEKTISSFKENLSKHRTGRANPDVLNKVMVSYYGSDVPISQVANITVVDALTLSIKPWEKHLGPEIEKAIYSSDLGLNPAASSDVIRVPFPPLTEERRREFIKKVKAEGEGTKVAVRNIRRDANASIKNLQKSNEISEDEGKRFEDEIQKLTDKYVAKVDDILKQKEQDLLEM